MSLYITINGMAMEMNSIGRSIQKKDPGFDISLLKVIHLCSNNSPPSFEAIIYNLECAKNLKILMEFYDIVQLNPVDPLCILKRLEVDEEKGKIFLTLVYTLYNILKYELLYLKKKKFEKKSKDISSDKASEGGQGDGR